MKPDVRYLPFLDQTQHSIVEVRTCALSELEPHQSEKRRAPRPSGDETVDDVLFGHLFHCWSERQRMRVAPHDEISARRSDLADRTTAFGPPRPDVALTFNHA